MTYLLSTFFILTAACLWYAASSQPAYRSGRFTLFLRSNQRVARIAAALFLSISGLLVFLSSGFAVSVFFVLVILMTALCSLLLLMPLIFKLPKGKPNAGK